MGEEKKAAAKDGDKKKEKDAGAAAPAGPQPIVLKVDLHCAGCAGKVRKAIKRAPGASAARDRRGLPLSSSCGRWVLFLTVAGGACVQGWSP
jgi:hypothetical protein